MSNVKIEITPEGAKVEVVENGMSIWKELDIQILIEIFVRATGKVLDQVTMDTPLLPPGIILYQEIDSSSYRIMLHREAHREPTVSFENTPYADVGVPATIYELTVRDKNITRARLWCLLSKSIITPEQDLYCWPFFNVYQDGSLCMGTAGRLEIEEPWQLFRWPGYFFSQSMTTHESGKNNSGLQGRSLMQALTGKDFPDEWLIPTDQKLKDVLSANSGK